MLSRKSNTVIFSFLLLLFLFPNLSNSLTIPYVENCTSSEPNIETGDVSRNLGLNDAFNMTDRINSTFLAKGEGNYYYYIDLGSNFTIADIRIIQTSSQNSRSVISGSPDNSTYNVLAIFDHSGFVYYNISIKPKKYNRYIRVNFDVKHLDSLTIREIEVYGHHEQCIKEGVKLFGDPINYRYAFREKSLNNSLNTGFFYYKDYEGRKIQIFDNLSTAGINGPRFGVLPEVIGNNVYAIGDTGNSYAVYKINLATNNVSLFINNAPGPTHPSAFAAIQNGSLMWIYHDSLQQFDNERGIDVFRLSDGAKISDHVEGGSWIPLDHLGGGMFNATTNAPLFYTNIGSTVYEWTSNSSFNFSETPRTFSLNASYVNSPWPVQIGNSTMIIFGNEIDGNKELYLSGISSSSLPIRLTNTAINETFITFSSSVVKATDGTVHVLFQNGSNGDYLTGSFCSGDLSQAFGQLCSFKAEMTAAQVIPDVDFVKGKTAVAMVKTTYNAPPTSTTNMTVYFYYDGQFVGLLYHNVVYGGNVTRDYFSFTPSEVKTNALMRATVTHNAEGYERTEVLEKYVNVTETDDLQVNYYSLDSPSNFDDAIDRQTKFINSTYPVRDKGLILYRRPQNYLVNSNSLIDGSTNSEDAISKVLATLEDRVWFENLRGLQTNVRVIAVANSSWFVNLYNRFQDNPILLSTIGVTAGGIASIVMENFNAVAAHEMGHQKGFLLCDEYDETTWSKQNNRSFRQIFGGCPNAKTNGNFNFACKPLGCPIHTLSPLYYPSSVDESTQLNNFMGSADSENQKWVANDSYSHILKNKLKKPIPIRLPILAVRGSIDKSTGSFNLSPIYEFEGIPENASEVQPGNYSIATYSSNGTVLINLSFQPSFFLDFEGNGTRETNFSTFVFGILGNNSPMRLEMKENLTLLKQVNRTANPPQLSIVSPITGASFSNELFNVTWNGTDADNDIISFTVLFSIDNETFSTVSSDYKNTSLSLNSSDFPDCANCTFRILASDGFNTAEAISDSFTIDNDLSIRNFQNIFTNNSQRIFGLSIRNTLNQSVSNISWSFDTGNGLKNSLFNFTLLSQEELFLFIFHNYTASGSFNVTTRAFNNQFLDQKTIRIVV